MELVTLADLRELIERHLPAHFRDKATWRVVAKDLKAAAQGADTARCRSPCEWPSPSRAPVAFLAFVREERPDLLLRFRAAGDEWESCTHTVARPQGGALVWRPRLWARREGVPCRPV